MRPRKNNRNLPARMYLKHGRYWVVERNKWHPLAKDYATALAQYASRQSATGTGMASLIDRFILEVASRKTTKTHKEYTRLGEKLKKVLAEFSPNQVKPHHVQQIVAHESKKHPTQANRMRQFLSAVFTYGATVLGVCDRNPCRDTKGVHVKKRDRYITDDEFSDVKKSANETIRCIMDFCYFTGQRIGDVLRARLSDITKEGVYFEQGKTGKKLMVEMTPELKAVIERAKKLHGRISGLTLFQARGGKQYSYFGVSAMFRRACEKAGVKDFHIHDIRAKSLTDLHRQGGNAQILGGHKNRSTTEHYIKSRVVEVVKPPKVG